MKNILKGIITGILSVRAKQLLKNNKTQVIAITGSIGKTSTKEAVHHLLKNHFKVYASNHGFNTPLGVCLTILQEKKSGFSSASEWFKILKRAFLDPKQRYEKIVIEMGADKPGDLAKLVKIAPPQIAIVTAVNAVHLGEGQFKDIEEIVKEKETLPKSLPENGLAVLNYDDKRVKNMFTRGEKMSYGQSLDYNLTASEISATTENLLFKVTHKGETLLFNVPVLGVFQVNILLPAIAVGLKLGLTLEQCQRALANFKLPPGRMNPIEGINDSFIIDSSYNASPKSTEKALELLHSIGKSRKIAALGTMNELGNMSEKAHLEMGKKAYESADILIAVGPEAANLKKGALEAGMKESDIFTFFDSEAAGKHLQNFLRPNDLMLVKGSQNKVRMEKAIKMIMKNPEKAPTLLCRQDPEWEKI